MQTVKITSMTRRCIYCDYPKKVDLKGVCDLCHASILGQSGVDLRKLHGAEKELVGKN